LGTVREIYVPEEGPVQIVLDFGNGVVINALSLAIAQRVAQGQTVYSQTEGSHSASSEEKTS
jgi:hypothetical protein